MRRLLVFAFACIASCSGKEDGSQVKEAPDSRNVVSRFQIEAMPSYDEILALREAFAARMPWSDVYWPLTQAGIARRWGKVGEPSALGFASFWKDQQEAIKAERVNPLLSPGEKYDLVYRLRHGVTWDDENLTQQIDRLYAIENDFASATDTAARRSKVAELDKVFRESTTFTAFSPMAADGWSSWLSYNKNARYKFRDEENSGEDWGWMGYCHGWAPAALMHEAPKHSVMARIAGKEVFFSEGDIRGLLTIAWGDHSPDPSQYFMGRRCNENTADPEGSIPVATNDTRGATGIYKSPSGEQKTFTMVDEYLPGAAAVGRRIYQIVVDKDPVPAYLIEFVQGAVTNYYLGADTEQLKVFVESGEVSGLTQVSAVKFFGCWDVNPASFHTVMMDFLGKKKIGFVMDRTRTGQVWNQPVYGAKFKVGELLEAAAVPDNFFRFRAPGTTYLAEVTAEVQWSSEPAKPSLDYADDFDPKRIKSLAYTYTLEFDANKRLIGGEWGTLTSKDPTLVIPDFLFAFKPGSEPKDAGNFEFRGILKPLWTCSLSADASQLKTLNIEGKDIAYTDCEIPVL